MSDYTHQALTQVALSPLPSLLPVLQYSQRAFRYASQGRSDSFQTGQLRYQK